MTPTATAKARRNAGLAFSLRSEPMDPKIQRQFIDALRQCLGLDPLYNRGQYDPIRKFREWMHPHEEA